MSFFTDYDGHLFAEGAHLRLYEKLGAHPASVASTTSIGSSYVQTNTSTDANRFSGQV